MTRKKLIIVLTVMMALTCKPTTAKASVCEMVKDTVPAVTKAIGEDWEQDGATSEEATRRKKDGPANVFKVSGGLSWITSEVYTDRGPQDFQRGYALEADYHHFWPFGLGVGLNALYYATTFTGGYKLRMTYIGPSLAYSFKSDAHWRMETAIGVGRSTCTEKLDELKGSESGVGALAQLGVEYMITEHVGLGLQVNGFIMRMKRPDDYPSPYYSRSKKDKYGIKRLECLFGLRFYL